MGQYEKSILIPTVFCISLITNAILIYPLIENNDDNNKPQVEESIDHHERYQRELDRLKISVLETDVKCLKSLPERTTERADEEDIIWPCVITDKQSKDKKKLEEMKKFKDAYIKFYSQELE
jgi:hypothetical protein